MMIYLELILTYKIRVSLTITNLNCIQPLRQNEIKYQGEAILILRTIGRGLSFFSPRLIRCFRSVFYFGGFSNRSFWLMTWYLD